VKFSGGQRQRIAIARNLKGHAHSARCATVRGMDRLVVIDGGCIVEQGTHDDRTSQAGSWATM
jgi:ABC-type multidrug transport system fused ATPase/permease subunit